MISETPQWSVALSEVGKRLGYNWELALTDEFVVGPWFCLNRQTGTLVWEKNQKQLGRPNKVIGVVDDVIVATETRDTDGPYIADYGAYGISLRDGSYLWPRLKESKKGWFARLMDFLPGFTNEFRATAWCITNEGILCDGGELLDLKTGELIGKRTISDKERASERSPRSALTVNGEICFPGVGRLRPGTPEQPDPPTRTFEGKPLHLFFEDTKGATLWCFDSVKAGMPDLTRSENPAVPWTLDYPWLFMLFRSAGSYDFEKNTRRPIHAEIWTLNLRSGTIVKKVPIAPQLVESPHIEVLDSQALVMSYRSVKQIHISYFARSIEA